MKKILITGANSYVGTSIEKWLLKDSDKYKLDTVDMRNGTWKEKDFSEYDVVFHVAGIVHMKEKNDIRDLYYKVNRDLAYETAKKAKAEGVKQFIFLSSMSVYGIGSGVIDEDTPLRPNSHYGKSKLQAEELIKSLSDKSFIVTILRPPMIYGKGCKGNYPRLANLALKTPIFPDINNKRSMIFIDNLCEFVKLLIDDYCGGIFFPQNAEFVKTSEMVRLIAKTHGKKMYMIKMLNSLLSTLNVSIINRVFGNLVYERSMSEYIKDYRIYDFETSIRKTEI